jgi:thiamine phosphate synthase YjbQ (UPF0047 family)
MIEVEVRTTARRELRTITSDVQDAVRAAGV